MTFTDFSADTDTETDNFRSLIVKTSKCQNVKMSKRQNVKTSKRQNVIKPKILKIGL